MINTEELPSILDGGVVVDEHGDKVGKVGNVYLDDQSGEASWVTAKTGLFGNSETFVPLAGASTQGSEVHVTYAKDTIKDAPRMDDDGSISPEQERELAGYYEMDGGDHGPGPANPPTGDDDDRDDDADGDRQHGDARHSASGDRDRSVQARRDDADSRRGETMTRSEEQVDIGTERVSTGRARLRKYVVTENVTKTVPVQHEEVRLEREPIVDGDRTDGVLGDDEQEVSLSEERVVVDKETVPVEKVRMDTDTVTEEQQVSEEVRKEEFDVDLQDNHDTSPRSGKGRE